MFEQAEKCNKKDHLLAKPLYEKIIHEIGDKPIHEMNDMELRFFARSKARIFLSSLMSDIDNSEKAIDAFELFFEKNDHDIRMYEEYILTLELTYQYEKAHGVLQKMLRNEHLKPTSLAFLSSFVYCAEGLQSSNDCLMYKKQLIDITADPKERRRLQKELEALNADDLSRDLS